MTALLEQIDLRMVFVGLCLFGGLICAYIMQASWQDSLLTLFEHWTVRWAYRCGMFWLVVFMLWSAEYGYRRSWQPWPPIVGMIGALDFVMLIRAGSLFVRRRRVEKGQVCVDTTQNQVTLIQR